jgi:hypothetical protein
MDCATLRYAILEAERELADPKTDPKVLEGLPEMIAGARVQLAALEAAGPVAQVPAPGGAA